MSAKEIPWRRILMSCASSSDVQRWAAAFAAAGESFAGFVALKAEGSYCQLDLRPRGRDTLPIWSDLKGYR
jgi:hypothetical protein